MPIWELLLARAIRQIEAVNFPCSCWQFGGGTVLMLEYNHRVSKDIDIFLDDVQRLTFLSPRLNDALDAEAESYLEQSTFVRLYFPEGEIDFISSEAITGIPPRNHFLCEKIVQVEHPVEIIAKKIHYRHNECKVRDIFDLATVIYHDQKTLLECGQFFLPYAQILEENLDKMKKDGILKKALNDIETLPGAAQILGNEYELCKLFLKNLRQQEYSVFSSSVLSPVPTMPSDIYRALK